MGITRSFINIIIIIIIMIIIIVIIIIIIIVGETELETGWRLCYSEWVCARDSCTCRERLSFANTLFSTLLWFCTFVLLHFYAFVHLYFSTLFVKFEPVWQLYLLRNYYTRLSIFSLLYFLILVLFTSGRNIGATLFVNTFFAQLYVQTKIAQLI